MFLQVDQVSIRYPRSTTAAVSAVSLGLAAGELGVLVGPSGSGKTSLLRAVAGLERSASGRILLDGTLLDGPGVHLAAEARRIGMVFQDFALFPHLDVAGNIGFGLRGMHADARRARVAAMLGLVGLEDAADKYPHQLSGGQQQRIALVRALAPAPRLLLLDEPFSSLDVELRERLAADVRDILKHTGTTALMVTHDQMEAFALGDVVGVMQQGRLEQWDRAQRLYHQPATRFVADFIGHGVVIDATVVAAQTATQTAAQTAAQRPDPHSSPWPGKETADAQPASPEWVVDTAVGPLRLESRQEEGRPAPALPARIDILVRAEDVVPDDTAALRAKVVDKSFRGASFLYTLELANGQRLLSLVPSRIDHAVGAWIGIGVVRALHLDLDLARAATGRHAGLAASHD